MPATPVMSCRRSSIIFVPLLFVMFERSYQIPLSRITLLITVNFCIQLGVDLLSTWFLDRIGYRAAILFSHAFSAAGLVLLTILPDVFPGSRGRADGRRRRLRAGRRAPRGADQPDHGVLSDGQQGALHEPPALVLLLGPYGRRAAVHGIFRCFRHRKVEDHGPSVGACPAGQRYFLRRRAALSHPERRDRGPCRCASCAGRSCSGSSCS